MQSENKMAVMPVGRLICQMSAPPLTSMFLQYSYNMIDSAFVAQLSESALTAVSLSFPITTLMCAASIWIGVGINVNQPAFPEDIADRATSLMLEAGRSFPRAPLIAAVMERFEEDYSRFLETNDLSGMREAYNELLVNVGRQVRVLEPGHEYTALSSGINDRGELLVQREDGSREAVFAGEVSVRGMYGYV